MLRRLIARERRGARELLAAACSATSGSTGSRSTSSTRAASSCACPRSACRDRGATTSGFAQTMEQVTGMAWITGHVDDQPRIQQGPSDPNAGMHAAFALIVGLAEREATGRGSLLEVTMVEGALNAACELVLETTAYGNLLERDGNRSPNVAPQGLYRGRDDETWLAISVATDAQWAALVDALGRPAWATDARPRDLRRPARPARRARRAPRGVGRDAGRRRGGRAAGRATACPPRVGRDPRSMIEHPQLQARGFYEEIDHPVVGRQATPTLAVPLRVGRPLAAHARADARPAQPRDPGRRPRHRRGRVPGADRRARSSATARSGSDADWLA